MTGPTGNRFRAGEDTAHALSSEEVFPSFSVTSAEAEWLRSTFAAADLHAQGVTFTHPTQDELKPINGVEKALSEAYGASFKPIALDLCAVGDALVRASRAK